MERKQAMLNESNHKALFWSTSEVMVELGVSRPTAYRLMHDSGALVRTPRRLRVYVPQFVAYLREDERV